MADEVKHILGELFITDVHLHDVGMLTVTRVILSQDLKIAKVYVSFLGERKSPEELIRQLISQRKTIRYIMGKRIKSKYVPDLRFFYDDSLAQAEHIEELINKIKTNSN